MSWAFWGNLGYSRTHLYSIHAMCVQRRSAVAKALLTLLIVKSKELNKNYRE